MAALRSALMSPTHVASALGLLTVSAAWSGGWIALKVGVADASPVAITTLRFVVAGALLLVIARVVGSELPAGRWRELCALAVLIAFGYNLVVAYALKLAPASDAGLLVNGLMPIIAGAMARILAAEPVTSRTIAGLVLGASGVGLIVVATDGTTMAPDRLIGDLLLLLGAVAWALYTVRGKALLAGPHTAIAVSGAIWFIGGALLVPVALVEGGLARVGSWPAQTWAALGYLIVIASAFGFAAYYALVAAIGPVRAASTVYLVPMGTLGLAALLLGEPVQPRQLVGGALTLLGVYLALERPRPGDRAEHADASRAAIRRGGAP